MAEQTLKITLTADNKAALAGLRETIAGLDGVSVAGKKAGDSVGKASKDFTGMSRVIQDLPYGFNAISNNLTQLVPAAGAAGLAFSGLVTAITFAQIGFGSWTRGLNDAKKANDEFGESAAKEYIKFRELGIAVSDVTKTMGERKDIISQMKSEYGPYLKGLSDEDILSGRIADSYDRLLTSLRAKVALQAAEERLIPIIKEQLVISEKLNQAKGKVAFGEELKASDMKDKMTMNGRDFYREAQAEATGAAATVKTLEKAYADLNKRIETYLGGMKSLVNQSKEFQKTEKETKIDYGPATQPYKPPKVKNRVWRSPLTQDMYRDTNVPDQLDFGANNAFRPLNMERDKIAAERYSQEVSSIMKQHEAMASQMTSMLTPAFDSLFSTMANGGDIGDALLNSFKQIGQELLGMVVKALIFQSIMKALKLSNPITAGAEGAATIAGGVGSLFNIIGILRGQDLQLMMDRTNTGNRYRRGG